MRSCLQPLLAPVPVALFSICLTGLIELASLAPCEAQELDFNRDIRPILSENCFYCHGQDEKKRESGLRLDVREEAISTGAIEPGDLEASTMVSRIRSTDSDTLMPPPSSNRTLSEKQKSILEQWIVEGAEYQTHWAFKRPERPLVPDLDSTWPKNAIDFFVLSKLIERNLVPSPEADRATLIKRLYSDLIGLPPTPDQVRAFIEDPSPDAYDRVVDQLLESQHYGERAALPWLDAARYADSNGFQQDGDTWQWIWRDWVVRALNADMPFDQFTIWQLAGDLLPEATTDQKIASGFNRNHLLNGEGGAIAEEQRFNVLFDRIDTTATTWLGLTMACAQCHDHKYDPITMRDYYQLLDAFNRVPETGTPQYYSSRIRLGKPVLEIPTPENQQRISEFEEKIKLAENAAGPAVEVAWAAWKLGIEADGAPGDLQGLNGNAVQLLQKPMDQRTDADKEAINDALRKFFDEKVKPSLKQSIPELNSIEALRNELNNYRNDQIPRVMVMSDAEPRESHILDRGQYLQPLEKVEFDTPAFLPPLAETLPRNRLGFALWLVSPEHPLTARVQVNRLWQQLFGAGLVKTAEDFGVQSEYPIHKDLLDWLAVEFVDRGWSMKQMVRLIVTSATYRQSSRFRSDLLDADRENRLYARASRFRMPSMVLRDWALSASGLLVDDIGGKPVYPYQPQDVWESLAITKERDFTYPASTGTDLYRRSLYTFWRRTVNPANMFDASSRQTCQVRVSITSTPLHALTTLNDPTWVEAARILAGKTLADCDSVQDAIRLAFAQVVCRDATVEELALLTNAFEKQLAIFENDAASAEQLISVGQSPRVSQIQQGTSIRLTEHAAMTMVCLGIFNLDEALTRQ